MTRLVRQTLTLMVTWTLLTSVIMAAMLIEPGSASTFAQAPPPGDRPSPQAVANLPDSGLAPQATHKLFLPLVNKGYFLITETILVDHTPRVYQALGGRLTLTFPDHAVSGPRELTVVSSSDLGPGELIHLEITLYNSYTKQIETGLNRPITIQMSYAGLDLSFVPESELAITSYGSALTTTVDTVHDTAAASTTHLSPFSLSWPSMQSVGASGMTAGNGGIVYLISSPNLYQIQPGTTTIVKRANLKDLAPADAKWGFDSKLAHNPTTDALYLTIGSHTSVYALEGSSLRKVYTTADGGTVDALSYHSASNSLYVATSKSAGWWGRESRILRINPANGALLSVYQDQGPYISDLAVSTNGTVAKSEQWTCASSNTANDPYNVNGQTFIGAQFLAKDDADNIYVANSGGDAISVLSGPSLTLSGIIRAARPTALAVAGGRILYVSNGRILEVPASRRDATAGGAVLIPSDTLSGNGPIITVQGSALERIPAHNVLTYNGRPLQQYNPYATCDYSAAPASIPFLLQPYLISPLTYIPVTAQKAHLAFSMGGSLKASADVYAPEMPVRQITTSDSPVITVTRGQWVQWGSAVQSLEGLFPTQAAGGLYKFGAYGTYRFVITDAYGTRNLSIGVAPFSAPGEDSKQIQSAVGGVLWASGAAMEIPADALPSYGGVYTVTFSSSPYTNPSPQHPTDSSPRYGFSFSPQPSRLDKAILLHLPYREGSAEQPKVAFYDPLGQDAFVLDSQLDTTPGYLLFTLPAGTYSTTVAAANATPGDGTAIANSAPQVAKPSIFRRGLNWLGSTGLWHAVGLPNKSVESANFQVLYHSNDCSDQYADNLLTALESTLIVFQNRGYQIPSTQVIVKVAPWIAGKGTPGVTPGIGSLYNYYIFINNTLPIADLQDTAAHEYFHVLQKENATVAGRYQNPVWFEEATATWAQYVVYDTHTGFFADALAGIDFPNHPISQYGNLSYQEQYAAMALAVYLEKEHAGAVLDVLRALGTMASIEDALNSVAPGGMGGVTGFYLKFAKNYWLQKFEPVTSWATIGTGSAPMRFTAASTMLPLAPAALSSGVIKGYWDQAVTPNPPESFNTGNGAAAYLMNAVLCSSREVILFDKTKAELGKFAGTGPDFGLPLSTAGLPPRLRDYTSANPIYFLYINATGTTPGTRCDFQLVVDAPTITGLSPAYVTVNQQATITVSGAGFGTKTGYVVAGGSTYTPSSWGPTQVVVSLPGLSPAGTVTVRVQLPSGALSNPWPLPINNP
jgi:hypothetical protein